MGNQKKGGRKYTPETIYTVLPQGHCLATLNDACRWSKLSAKETILSIAKVVTFEETPKFWGIEDWRKCWRERTRWTWNKALPVCVDVMACCSFFIDFYALSSSSCCIKLSRSTSLMIIFSSSSIFYTPSYSSCCSTKEIWESLGELIYHFLEQICCDLFLTVSFEKLSSYCCNNEERTASL